MIYTDLPKQIFADIRVNPLLIRVNRIILFVLLTFNFYLLILAQPVSAQSFSLSISPSILEVMIKPGKTVTYAYSLINGGEDLILNSQVVLFTPKDELGNILLKDNLAGVPNFFSFGNTDTYLGIPFSLKSREEKQIILKISIPKDAEEKDYYLTLLFTSQDNKNPGVFGTKQTGAIGSNLLLTISDSGKPLRRGEIVAFKVQNAKFKIIDSFDMPEFLLRIKNYGKTLWKPYGKITISGLFGQKWQQDILPQNVLAESIRQIQISTPSAGQQFLLGSYQVKAEFALDQEIQDQIVTGSISFIALPIRMIVFVLTILLIVSTVKLVSKNRTHKTSHQKA